MVRSAESVFGLLCGVIERTYTGIVDGSKDFGHPVQEKRNDWSTNSRIVGNNVVAESAGCRFWGRWYLFTTRLAGTTILTFLSFVFWRLPPSFKGVGNKDFVFGIRGSLGTRVEPGWSPAVVG